MKPIIWALLLGCSISNAQDLCELVGLELFGSDNGEELGTYLGQVSDNPYSQTSILNEFGAYGSEFSQTSIRNEFGSFGSEFSRYSAYNPYALDPPILYRYDASDDLLYPVVYVSKNEFLGNPTIDPDELLATLENGCGGNWDPPELNLSDLAVDSMIVRFAKEGDTVVFGALFWNVGDAASTDSAWVHAAINGEIVDSAKIPPLNPLGLKGVVFRNIQSEDSLLIAIGVNLRREIVESDTLNNVAWGIYVRQDEPTAIQKVRPKISRKFKFEGRDLQGRLRQR